MAIALDQSATNNNVTGGASITTSFTGTAGASLIIVRITSFDADNNVASITYNGQSGTKRATTTSSSVSAVAHIWTIPGSACDGAAHNLVVNFSPNSQYGAYIRIDSVTGSDTTTPVGNIFATYLENQTSPRSDSITVSAGSMVFDAGDCSSSCTAGGSQSSDFSTAWGGDFALGSHLLNATAMSWTFSGTATRFAHAGIEVKAAGGASLAVTITSPTSSPTYNNGTTSTITLGGTATLATSVTWANDRGGSGSATNTGTSYSTWSITGITLSLGSNVITVTAGDGSTTVTDTITVTYTATPENCRGFNSLGVGSTDKITSALTTHATQRTYAVWFNNVDANLLLAKYTTALTEQINLGLGPIYYQRVWTGGTAGWSAPGPGTAWHHLAITYDSSSTSNAPLIYVDGVSQTVTLQTAASGTLVNNSDPYTIGNNGAGTGNWDGMLSEFAIWNRILSAAEILDLATAAGGYQGKSPLYYPTSLAEYIPLNDSPVTSKVLANPTVTGTAVQTGLAIDYPSVAGQLTATFTDSLAGGELL